MGKVEYAFMSKPYPGQSFCGDQAWIHEENGQLFLCLIDAAGHGFASQKHSRECISIIKMFYKDNLKKIIERLHQYCKSRRAIVIGLALIDISAGFIKLMSYGNISTLILGKQEYRFVSRFGMLGSSFINPILQEYILNNGDILLMYSDGISNQLRLKGYPEIFKDPIELIPQNIILKFAKVTDDASCIVMRYLA